MGYCEYFKCNCNEVTEELQEEYGENCLIDCTDCEWYER